ncbi:PREDICTED: transmembrane and coiled-coil domain-containing protein 3-like, partial [Priapulus caudatus]|uniref:Transmembrane and coiled-coil domain-containing protein 3-like n=1 Tax=Priapulus caudatus TaxID=37621 RepID=A0ABM1F789_PRICU
MQDVLLGLLIALLPSLVVAHNSDEDSSTTTAFAFLVARLMAVLAGVMAAGLLASRFVIGSVLAQLSASGSRELMTVGAVAICFFMLLVTHTLHISMELGCFVVGAMVGSQRHELVSDIKNLIHPIRDFFAVLFFASVGMHVFPSFVAYELTVIIWLTLAVVLIKYALSMAVLSCLLPQKTSHVRWIVSAGLSQVSEFSFVLASRARRLHLINRE